MGLRNRINKRYPMKNSEEAVSTKERILLKATILFAQKGVAAVSIRDIAKELGISPASFYNHFESKDALWDEIIENIKNLYLLYFERLEQAIAQASSYQAVLDCMFTELFQVVDIFTYYGISLIQSEQIRNEKAYRVYCDIFFTYSIDFISGKFDKCIKLGWARKFNTRFAATAFMHNVMIGNILRTHQNVKQELPYNVDDMYASTYEWLYESGAIDGD